ncbi:MAG TPA: hypothetical protein VM369_01860, partial [Candidatus Binatia bacterium]|nr:hypothetical protein [Candidatus Binatia bacterium]
MRLSVMLAAAALLAGGATYAADPASGTLTDTSGALSYTGGPFVVSNPTPDPVHAIDPQCVDGTPLCDTYVLTVDVGDGLRGDAANADALVSFRMSFTNALSDFDLYIYDSGGNLVASSTNGGGAPESTSVPLSDLKNGEYRIVIVPYNSAADSYEASVEITDLGNADKGGLLAAGAAGPGLLLPLLALAGLRRRIARLAPVLALGLAGTAFAADPATIDNTHASVAFSGGPYVLPNPSPDATDATGDPVC